MRMLIGLLSVVVAVFAGYTVWNDPTVGPRVQAMLPDSISEKLPVIARGSTSGTPQASGRYGGIGAANSVAGAVVGSVQN